MTKSILITGIHGFVGNNLVESLKNNYKIFGLDIISRQKDGVVKTFGWNELNQIDSIDIIIHLAGKAHDTRNTAEESVYFEINVGLTKKIFDFYLNSNASKFIFFSSVKAVADTLNGNILDENQFPNPATAYGKSKLEAERFLNSSKVKTPKKIFILRPGMIYGPGNKGNLNLLYNLVNKRIPWPLGEFNNHRSFVSIENVQFIIQQIIEKNIESGIYNVVDDEPLSTNRIIELIAESKNRKAKIWRIKRKWIGKLAKIGDSLSLPLNSERLKKLTESFVVSNQKIKNAIGIEKMPVTAEEGMSKTLKSFRTHK